MRCTSGSERSRTESKLHLTAVLRLRNKKKVDDIKVVFMKNSYLDMSMLSKRSPKAGLFATHLLSILLLSINTKFYFINNTKTISVEENSNLISDTFG